MKNIDEVGKWIPVTERLPEKEGEYIVTGRFDENAGFTCKKNDYSSNLRSIIFGCGPEEIIEKTKAHLEKASAAGLRQIITDCGYSLEEIYETVKEMRDES